MILEFFAASSVIWFAMGNVVAIIGNRKGWWAAVDIASTVFGLWAIFTVMWK